MSGNIEPTGVPPGVPANLITPQGNMPAIGVPNTQDYPRLVFTSPYFETVAIAEIIQPSVTEAVEAALPSLIPPYVDQAVLAGVQQYSVLLTGSTMSGPLFLSPLMPTQPSQAATMAYVDAMLATAGIPEVPPVPQGQIWARETGQWVPISQSEGTFLPLTGGSMQGSINMSGNTITNMAAVPAMPNGAAPAQWVLNQIASVSLFQGQWNADTNVPDLTQLSVRVNAYTWIAVTTSVSGVVIGPAIPGLQGKTIFNGDTIYYSTVDGAFFAIHAGGLTLPEAQSLFVLLAGSQMSGALLLNSDATQNMQAVTFQQLEAAVANTVTPDAPADGQAYLRVGVGTNRWVPGLPLAGGILTGAITLAGNATSALMPVPLQQMTSAITAGTAGLLPIAGGTMTGPIVLASNATTNLNPVPLQQLNAMLASYLPLAGGEAGGVILSGGDITATAANIGGVLINSNNISASGSGSAIGGVSFTGGGSFTANGTGSIGGVTLSGGALTTTGNAWVGAAVQLGGGPFLQNSGGLMYCSAGLTVNGGVAGLNLTISGNSVLQGAVNTQGVVTTFDGGAPNADNNQSWGAAGVAWFQVASYNFAQQSDPRGKVFEALPPDALAKVEAIPVHRFTYTRDASHAPHTGFDASEVEPIYPDGVMTGTDEAQTKAILLGDMLGLLWQAVQELAAKIPA